MIDLSSNQVAGLPVDQLGLLLLSDLIATNEWNEYNYLLAAERTYGRGPALDSIAEAMGWLRARALIARKPGQTSDAAIFVTRTGRRVAEDGPKAFYAVERLQSGMHPVVEAKARPQFLIGEYEQGVFASMKAVEVRVRELGGFGDDAIGVELMNKAFGPKGPLTDTTAVKGEQEGTRALFAGAYAVFRNPSGHREVDFDDVSEAAEMVQTASLLMRILDRVARRLGE
ncbi:MAG TPA: TIGR02391 family protein [Acidimicrobiales bacterium]|nr:TIGR02391 family protein [Acidimicrobiales bacterium]